MYNIELDLIKGFYSGVRFVDGSADGAMKAGMMVRSV